MITDLDGQKVSKKTRYVYVGQMKGGLAKFWHTDLELDDETLYWAAQALEGNELHHFVKLPDKPRRKAPFNPIWTAMVGMGVIGASYFLILGAVWCVIKLIGG
jgi:hypothetical protein